MILLTVILFQNILLLKQKAVYPHVRKHCICGFIYLFLFFFTFFMLILR